MTDAVRVDLFGIACNTGVRDASGVEWNVASVEGWSSPRVRQSIDYSTGRSGAVALFEQYGERALRVSGDIVAPDQATAWAVYEALSVMPGVGASGVVAVYESTPKQLVARQADQPEITDPVGGRLDFLLSLVAVEPFKRAISPTTASISAGGSVSVTNNGTAPAFVSVTATSAGSVRVRQNSSGQVLRTRASVASGTVFDAQSRTVRSSGGVAVYGVMDSPSEWLSIPRLSTVTFANLGTADVDLSTFDTFA